MFILERLIGVGIYALLLLLVCLSLVGKSHKKIKRILFLYTVTLSILAFFYVPYETADLYRIYESVDLFSKFSFSEFWEWRTQRGDAGISNLLYWGVGKLGVSRLLPALTTFVCYSCVFYIIRKTAEKNNISGKNVAIALLFYMSTGNYMFVVTGIRCMLGISLLAFCFYRESVEGKFSIAHIPLYLISALIHSFSVILIAIRFLASALDFNMPIKRKIAYLLSLGVGGLFVLSYFEEYIQSVFDKADSYVNGDLYSYFWEYVIAILAVVVMGLVLLNRKKLNKNSMNFNVLVLYEIISLFTALCFCYEFTIFHRFTTYIMPIVALPMLMVILQKRDFMQDKKQIYRGSIAELPLDFTTGTVIISLLMLFVACARGSLCSFKLFVL